MKNPTFGKWPADDEVLEPGARREPADPAAEEALAEVFDRLSRQGEKGASGAGDPGTIAAAEEAPRPRLALSLPRGPAPDPRGADLPWEKLHERPFRPDEAAELLAAAGIGHEGIVSCYVAGWQSLCDPETGRGPIAGQAVVALVKTEDGSQMRPVHLAFAWDGEAKAWRLARAMVELAV